MCSFIYNLVSFKFNVCLSRNSVKVLCNPVGRNYSLRNCVRSFIRHRRPKDMRLYNIILLFIRDFNEFLEFLVTS